MEGEWYVVVGKIKKVNDLFAFTNAYFQWFSSRFAQISLMH